jgi:hypothetical protein
MTRARTAALNAGALGEGAAGWALAGRLTAVIFEDLVRKSRVTSRA